MISCLDSFSEVWKNDIGFLQIVSDLSGLSAALWTAGKPKEAGSWTSSGTFVHPCFVNDSLRTELEKVCHGDQPGIYFDNDQFFYGAMQIGPFCLALGPAAVFYAHKETIRQYAETYGCEESAIVKTDLIKLTQYMNLLHYHFIGTPIREKTVVGQIEIKDKWSSSGALEAYQLEQSENDRTYEGAAAYENKLFQTVAEGNVQALKEILSNATIEYKDAGSFFPEQSKEREYLVVSIITILTRVAIQSGVPLEEAHELGAVFLNKLGNLAVAGKPVFGLSYNAMLEFTELIKRRREEKSRISYTEACKAYIEKNFRKDLQVSDIAEAVGLTRTYLSRLFHESEGMTIQQYIQKTKCRHAANMLQYTDYPIAEIAQYNGFSSQSYFGVCFQNWYGMTPNAYRKAKR